MEEAGEEDLSDLDFVDDNEEFVPLVEHDDDLDVERWPLLFNAFNLIINTFIDNLLLRALLENNMLRIWGLLKFV